MMARIRSVHPGLFTDEAFLEASMAARVLLIGIWTECDDSGVFEWKPIRFKMRIFPADNVDVAALLEELTSVGWIKGFDFNGKAYGGVRNFCKWQRPKSPQTIHPCPDEIDKFVGLSASRATEDDKPSRGTALGRLLCEQQDGACFYCESAITFYRKKPNSLEIDHRLPVSRGGEDGIANLAASCRRCNSLKADMTDVEFMAKFAPSELRARHGSDIATDISGGAKIFSQMPKTLSGEMSPQMEEEGGRREDGERKKEDTLAPTRSPPVEYAFAAKHIRLTKDDFDRWRTAFPDLSLEAELWSLDEWAAEQGKKWFHAVASALAKKQRETKRAATAAADPFKAVLKVAL